MNWRKLQPGEALEDGWYWVSHPKHVSPVDIVEVVDNEYLWDSYGEELWLIPSQQHLLWAGPIPEPEVE